MADRHAPKHAPRDFEAIQEQVAQLRANLAELGQTLLEWGQHEVGAARNGLQAKAQDFGEALSERVERSQKRGRKAAEAVGHSPEASSRASSLPAISAGLGVLLLLVSGVSWATKRLSR